MNLARRIEPVVAVIGLVLIVGPVACSPRVHVDPIEVKPIYLTVEDENPNSADVLFLVGGAQPSDWAAPRLTGYARIVLLFDGRDADALGSARGAWKKAKDAGHGVTYWKESAGGKWEKQG